MIPDQLIKPPITAQTPLGSLSGWTLVIHCGRCGEKNLPVHKIATSAAIYARPIGDIIAKAVCSCGQRPIRLQAECEWAKAALPPRTRIDLSWLLPGADDAVKNPIEIGLNRQQDNQFSSPREAPAAKSQLALF